MLDDTVSYMKSIDTIYDDIFISVV